MMETEVFDGMNASVLYDDLVGSIACDTEPLSGVLRRVGIDQDRWIVYGITTYRENEFGYLNFLVIDRSQVDTFDSLRELVDDEDNLPVTKISVDDPDSEIIKDILFSVYKRTSIHLINRGVKDEGWVLKPIAEVEAHGNSGGDNATQE